MGLDSADHIACVERVLEVLYSKISPDYLQGFQKSILLTLLFFSFASGARPA